MTKEATTEDFYRSVAQKREALRIKEDERRKGIKEQQLVRNRTRYYLMRVAFGSDELKFGDFSQNWLNSDWKLWSKEIVELAQSWKVHPGPHAHIERPIPDKGLGFEAAKRIFDLAMDGATSEAIYDELIQAREALAPWREGHSREAGSVYDLLVFFQQLCRYYDGSEWRPPISDLNPLPTAKTERKRRLTWMTVKNFAAEFNLPLQTVHTHRNKLGKDDVKKDESGRVLLRTSAMLTSLRKTGRLLHS